MHFLGSLWDCRYKSEHGKTPAAGNVRHPEWASPATLIRSRFTYTILPVNVHVGNRNVMSAEVSARRDRGRGKEITRRRKNDVFMSGWFFFTLIMSDSDICLFLLTNKPNFFDWSSQLCAVSICLQYNTLQKKIIQSVALATRRFVTSRWLIQMIWIDLSGCKNQKRTLPTWAGLRSRSEFDSWTWGAGAWDACDGCLWESWGNNPAAHFCFQSKQIGRLCSFSCRRYYSAHSVPRC